MATYTENYSLTKPSGADLVKIADLNKNMDTIDALIHDTRSMLSEPFDEELTYKVDDIVFYDHVLYRCIEDITEPGAFDSTKWVKVTVAGLLSELEAFIHHIKEEVYELIEEYKEEHPDEEPDPGEEGDVNEGA